LKLLTHVLLSELSQATLRIDGIVIGTKGD